VHTDIGNRCVAAKVDRRLAPLRTVLRNGQTVEVITAKGAQPNPAWASFVTSAKARAAIRQFLKGLKRGEARELGVRLLNQSLEEFKLSLRSLPDGRLEQVAAALNFQDGDELLEKIGLGERPAPLVARRLLPRDESAAEGGVQAPLSIAGTEGLLVSYARCCFPVPPDAIVAYLSSGRGVVIHRDSCGNVAGFRKQPEKWIPAVWQKQSNRTFRSEVKVHVSNRMGVLAQVAAQIAANETNIDHVNVTAEGDDTSMITLEIDVRDRSHLARVLRAIKAMPDVLKVERTLA
jgi:(p)ppGpp synthase/HD superfamily hydrolase